MSSSYIRQQIINFFTSTIVTETHVIDLTGESETLGDLLARNGITHRDNWVGLQFVGNEEIPISVGATNTKGCYRELGTVYIHVVAPTKIGVASEILPRSELIRDAFRGQRLGDMWIDSVSPPNFGNGAAISFEGGFTGASILLDYRRDLNI